MSECALVFKSIQKNFWEAPSGTALEILKGYGRDEDGIWIFIKFHNTTYFIGKNKFMYLFTVSGVQTTLITPLSPAVRADDLGCAICVAFQWRLFLLTEAIHIIVSAQICMLI